MNHQTLILICCFLIWLICCDGVISEDVCPEPALRKDPTWVNNFTVPDSLSYMILSSQSGDVFVSSKNTIHRLSSDLTRKESYHYVDVSDNTVKLMLVDHDNDILLACGTAHQGLCYSHSLQNISNQVTLLNGHDHSSNFITSLTGSTVGIIAPQQIYAQKDKWDKAFYFARTLDDNLPDSVQQSVSSKQWNPSMNGFKLTVNGSESSSAKIVTQLSVKKEFQQSYKIEYLYAFSHHGFTYFVTKQLTNLTTRVHEIRLVRVCQSDVGFYSYVEMSLVCKSQSRGRFRNPIDAFLVNVTSDYKARNSINFVRDDAILFVLCGRDDEDSDTGFNEYGVCGFPMSLIEQAFHDGLSKCNTEFSYNYGLEFIFDNVYRSVCGNHLEVVKDCPTATDDAWRIHIMKKFPRKNILMNENGEDITFSSIPTSIAVTVYGEKTFLVMGFESGSVDIYHIGAYPKTYLPKVTVSFGSQPISSHLEVKDSTIYALTDKAIFQHPLENSCRYISSCRECLAKSYLQCGYCGNHGCLSETECKKLGSNWSNSECIPAITSVSPLTGPVEGGTRVTICGEALGRAIDDNIDTKARRNVFLGDKVNCTIVNEENYNQLVCLTRTSDSIANAKREIKLPITMEILAGLKPIGYEYKDRFKINRTLKIGEFSFYPVKVHGFSPQKGSENGGTLLTVTGQHLDVGGDVSVMVGTSSCRVIHREASLIKCVTSAKDGGAKFKKNRRFAPDINFKDLKPSAVTTRIDNFNQVQPLGFQYMPAASLNLPKTPFSSIKSGGVAIYVSGRNLDSVANPQVAVYQKTSRYEKNLTCEVVTGRLKDQYLKFITPPLDGEAYGVKIVLDNLIEIHNMFVYKDPEVEKTIKVVDGANIDVIVKGSRMRNGCQTRNKNFDEYDCFRQVYIDDLLCPKIIEVEDSRIDCQVRQKTLEEKNKKRMNVTVYFGYNLILSAGVIDLSTPSNSAVVAGAIVGAIVLILIIVVICLWKKLRDKKRLRESAPPVGYSARDERNNTYIGSRSQNGQNLDRVPLISVGSFRDHLPPELLQEMSPLLINPSRVIYNRDDVIGKGNFGIVFHGKYYPTDERIEGSEVKVAIKTMSKIEDFHAVEHFLREALIMKDFKDDHVLTLIGVLMDEKSCPMVVLPFMKHGDLLMFIRNPNNKPTVKDLVGFGLQACKGMQYLANNRFVHRDLAARNCMLDEDYTVKVADFGLARDIYEKEYYKPHDKVGRMPVKWMALESLLQQKFNTTTDVWSFGILMWELVTRGVTPYPDVDAFDVCQYLLDGRRLKQTEFCPNELYDIMLRCWSPTPEERPSFDKLVVLMSEILKNVHGVNYPGLDITYVNLDSHHAHPSQLRTDESRSTGGSDVFSPGAEKHFSRTTDHPPLPARNQILSNDNVFPSTPLLANDDARSSAELSQDGEGYLLPSTSGTPKPRNGIKPSVAKSINRNSDDAVFSPVSPPGAQDEEGYLLPSVSDTPKGSPSTFGNLRKKEGGTRELTMQLSEDSNMVVNNASPRDHHGEQHNSESKSPRDPSHPLVSSMRDKGSFVVPPSPLQSRAAKPIIAPKPSYINETSKGGSVRNAEDKSSKYHNIDKENPDALSNPTYLSNDGLHEEEQLLKGKEKSRNRNNGNNREERYVNAEHSIPGAKGPAKT